MNSPCCAPGMPACQFANPWNASCRAAPGQYSRHAASPAEFADSWRRSHGRSAGRVWPVLLAHPDGEHLQECRDSAACGPADSTHQRRHRHLVARTGREHSARALQCDPGGPHRADSAPAPSARLSSRLSRHKSQCWQTRAGVEQCLTRAADLCIAQPRRDSAACIRQRPAKTRHSA
jgi:hypothetical protein